MHDNEEALSIEELVEIGEWIYSNFSSSSKLNIYYSTPIAFKPLGQMFGDEGHGCGVCNIRRIIGVLPDGSYSLCGIGTNVPELIFGHPDRDSLKEIWFHTNILNELREGLPQKLE